MDLCMYVCMYVSIQYYNLVACPGLLYLRTFAIGQAMTLWFLFSHSIHSKWTTTPKKYGSKYFHRNTVVSLFGWQHSIPHYSSRGCFVLLANGCVVEPEPWQLHYLSMALINSWFLSDMPSPHWKEITRMYIYIYISNIYMHILMCILKNTNTYIYIYISVYIQYILIYIYKYICVK